MTKQMKLLLSGILLLILLTALAMFAGKRGRVSPLSPQAGAPVADQARIDPVRSESQPDIAGQTARRKVAAPTPQAQPDSAVSQAQIELMTKREEARQRRDEMLKMREETIRKLGPGNTGDTPPAQ